MTGLGEAQEGLGTVVHDATGHRPRVVHVVAGPETHGITRHALDLLACGEADVLRIGPGDDPADRLLDLLDGSRPDVALHIHLHDTLLGPRTVDVVRGATRHARTTLTLHDLPDPREGAERYARRSLAYAEMWQAATGVVVSSRHEADLLRATAGMVGLTPEDLPPVSVVPLPLTPPRQVALEDRRSLEPVVAVLGYLYPGKGHDQAISVAAHAGLRGVLALGAVSPGHEAEATALADRARGLGLTWEVTGFLPDEELLRRARKVAVPLAWHAHVSASASIGSWLEAGRRPLVADGGWVRELAERCPGTVTVVPDEEQLQAAVTAAMEDPASTFVAPDVRLRPTTTEAWAATDAAIASAHRLSAGTAP